MQSIGIFISGRRIFEFSSQVNCLFPYRFAGTKPISAFVSMLITLVPTKFLRYEAHVDRQLCRAINQLERLQRQRRGEAVPPPLNINLGEEDTFFAKQSQDVLCFQ